jgi:hypothetical protein
MKLLVVLETVEQANSVPSVSRYGDIVCFTEGTHRNDAVCGLDIWDVRDAYDRLGDWWRVEALYDTNICAVRCCVSCLQVCVKFL